MPFVLWAEARGLVPWDVPPLGRELPPEPRGRRALVGAFRGVLDGGTPFVVRQVLFTAPDGALSWWTSAMSERSGHVAYSSDAGLEAEDLDALLEALEAEVLAQRRGEARIRLVA